MYILSITPPRAVLRPWAVAAHIPSAFSTEYALCPGYIYQLSPTLSLPRRGLAHKYASHSVRFFLAITTLYRSSLSGLRVRVTACPLSLLSSRHRPDAGLQTAACRTTLACRGSDIERTISKCIFLATKSGPGLKSRKSPSIWGGKAHVARSSLFQIAPFEHSVSRFPSRSSPAPSKCASEPRRSVRGISILYTAPLRANERKDRRPVPRGGEEEKI